MSDGFVYVEDELPDPYTEVIVLVSGKRGALWRNNYPLVAFMSMTGSWHEERHPSKEPLQGVYAWKHIGYIPEKMPEKKKK